MVLKWLENIDRLGKIKSCNSKSGVIFLLRPKPDPLRSIFAVFRFLFTYLNQFLATNTQIRCFHLKPQIARTNVR